MYIPPNLRNTLLNSPKIENLCDEFLHIDDTPEANICRCCSENNTCMRKSVTCIVILKKDEKEVYSNLYKNKSYKEISAIHAEMFAIYDQDLRNKFDYNQTLNMYLTFQPCHYSGGHNKVKNISCTESLQKFYIEFLKPFNISFNVKFAYLYRAHWIDIDPKYNIMIENAKKGLKILSTFANVSVIDTYDIDILKKFCHSDTEKKLNSGHYDQLILNRSKIVQFIEKFLKTIID